MNEDIQITLQLDTATDNTLIVERDKAAGVLHTVNVDQGRAAFHASGSIMLEHLSIQSEEGAVSKHMSCPLEGQVHMLARGLVELLTTGGDASGIVP